MAWGAPSFLFALALLAVPILLHLSRRRRMVPLPYSSLRFLLAGARQRNRRSALRRLVLLVLRCAALALLCLFFARPTLRTAETAVAPELGGASVVVVIDQSLSMAARDRGVVRFERARERAAAFLFSLRPEDRVGLVLTSERPNRLTPALTTDKTSLVRRLSELTPLPVGSDNHRGLAVARDLLRKEKRPEIVLITDMQRSAWDAPSPLEGATREIDLHILDVGYDGTENAAIVGLSAEPERPAPGETVDLRLRAARYQAALPAMLEVRARLFSEFEQVARVHLPAAGITELPFTVQARAVAPPVMQFQLADDALREDNIWYFSLDTPVMRPWLVLEGDRLANRGLGGGYYLAAALGALAAGRRPVAARPPEADWSDADLIACFGAVRLPDAGFRPRLDAFLARGGLALFFVTANLDLDSWNSRLLAPYFNGRLAAPINRPARLERVDYAHPFFALWTDARNGDPLRLGAGVAYSWAESPRSGRVAARLRGGGPAIVELVAGKGRLVFFNFAPGPEDRLDELWISLLGEIIAGAAGQSSRPPAYMVGEHVPLRAEAARGVANVMIDVENPEGAVERVPLTQTGPGVFEGRLAALRQPGVYRATAGQPAELLALEPRLFCVNASRMDSDLSRIDPGELQRLLAGYRVDWIANQAEAEAVLAAHRRGRSLEAVLLALLACVWLGETLAGVWGLARAPKSPAAEAGHV